MLAYYRELPAPDQAAADNHLAACETCRAARTQLVETLGLVDAAPAAEAPPGFERVMWARVEAALPPPSGLRAWFVPRWALAAAGAAVVVVAAFVAGRWSGGAVTPPPTETVAVTAPASDTPERILLVAAGDHFDRSQMVLAELVNADPSQAGILDAERAPGGRPGVDQPRDPAVGGGRRRRSDGRAARGSRAGAVGSGQRRGREHRRRAGDGEGANRVAGDSVPPPGDHLRRAAARGAAAARRKARRCRERRARWERR